MPDVGALLKPQWAARRSALNSITGHTAAMVIRALLFGGELRTSLPGPEGCREVIRYG